MICSQCGISNPDGQKYCGACGILLEALAGPTKAAIESAVRQEVSQALSGYVKDQRIAEFDITEKVANRLIGWGKIVGVVFGLLIAGAGYLGFKSVKDVVDGLKTEMQRMAQAAKKSADELNGEMAVAKGNVESLNNQRTSLEAEFGKQRTSLQAEFDKERTSLQAEFAQMERDAGPIHEKLAKLQTDLEVKTTGLTTSIDQLKTKVSQLDTSFRKLPGPTGAAPYHLRLEDVVGGGDSALNAQNPGVLIFQATGDTGGIADPVPQQRVAKAMTAQFTDSNATRKPSFLYLLGDLVYFNGESQQYQTQFYQPYSAYPAPIFAIAGNHDGDNLPPETSLAAFMANFCAPTPIYTPAASGSARSAMTQPNVYWTLQTSLATIIGLYTNVPENGAMSGEQLDWLVHELETAPLDKALILTLHHPPVSFGPIHGSTRMAGMLENAFNKARRVPNMILSAHVNNYQRIDVELRSKLVVPFFVIGTGGYHNLRPLPRGRSASTKPALHGNSRLMAGVDNRWGFVTFEVSANEIKGRFIGFRKDTSDTGSPADEFTYSAKPIVLGNGQTVSLGEDEGGGD
jgi:acid phosphatase type 7